MKSYNMNLVEKREMDSSQAVLSDHTQHYRSSNRLYKDSAPVFFFSQIRNGK